MNTKSAAKPGSSTGPRTAAGKARSSQNARKHGLTSRAVVLPHEDPAPWLAHLQTYMDRFRPAGAAEARLVEQIAAAQWRIRRAWAAETEGLDREIQSVTGAALAYRNLTDNSRTLAALDRQEARLTREFHRTLAELLELQSNRAAQPVKNANLQNELPAPQPAPIQKALLQNEPNPSPATPQPASPAQIPTTHPLRKPILQNEPNLSSATPQPSAPAQTPATLPSGKPDLQNEPNPSPATPQPSAPAQIPTTLPPENPNLQNELNPCPASPQPSVPAQTPTTLPPEKPDLQNELPPRGAGSNCGAGFQPAAGLPVPPSERRTQFQALESASHPTRFSPAIGSRTMPPKPSR